jgi:Undecaprenyl-phosphate glucose phosphotransferase
MIRRRLKNAHFFLKLAVFLMPLAAFSVAGYFRFATHLLPHYSADVDAREYFGLLLLTTILWAIIAEHFELTSLENLLAGPKTRGVLKACIVTFAMVLAATFFYRDTTFSRLFIWMSGLNLFLLTLCVQAMFRWLWTRTGSLYKTGFHVLIVGADDFAVRVAHSLSSDPIAPCRVKGCIRIPGQACAKSNLKVYELADIEELAIGNGFDDVIIALPPALLGELPALREKLSPLCVPMRLALDVGEAIESRAHVFAFGNLMMLNLQETPAESALYIVLKRAFDLLFSIGILLFAAPLFAFISLAIKLTSPGPVFFVQERVGLNGKLFRMFKFRTMNIAPPSETDTRWTVRDDPRCTRLGRILRHTGMDELPQFFNVLKGDMSVVGPRPERPKLVQGFMQSVGNYNRRHYLKVGITGWAQVNGWRGDTSIEKRIEYDLYYVRHWTLTFDLLIVALTLVRGFTDKNAY